MGKKLATFGENGSKMRDKRGRKLRKRETKWGQIGGKQKDKKGAKEVDKWLENIDIKGAKK